MKKSLIQIGNYNRKTDYDNPQIGRVYDASGICPTIDTMGGVTE